MADEEENSPGPACRRLGIYSSKLRNALKSDEALTCLKTSDFPVTNDVVLELLTFKNASKFSFNDMLKWTGSLIGSSTKDIAVGTFASRVRSLQQRRARLLKDKASDQIAVLLAEPFILPSPSSGQSESGERQEATPLDPTGHTSSSAHVAGSQHATPLEPTTYTTSPADVDSQRAASSEPAANTTTSADNVDCELEPTAKRLRVENE